MSDLYGGRNVTQKVGAKSTITETNVTDASASAAEGATSLSGGSSLSITQNTVDPEITGQAFGAIERTTAAALGYVPAVLDAQRSQNENVLRAAQQQSQQAEQFASIGAGLARGAQTGGASTLLEGPAPYIIGAVVLAALYFITRKN